jgi:UDP-N-acetylglucosamine 4-epimerase
MNILLTGGCGFIGSNLVPSLLKHEKVRKLIVLDNLSTGKIRNLDPYLSNHKLEFIQGDIRDYETCLRVAESVDVVCHQAALGSVPRSIRDPLGSNATNITGFLNMLVASKENGVKRIVFAASSSTYGDSLTLPKKEEIIGKPLSPYAVTKYVNELYAEVFSRNYGLSYIGLRYFNVFGPNQDPDSSYAAVVPLFCKRILTGEPISINGDGSISRDFTYVENVVQANLLSIFTDNSKALDQIYNVACGESHNIKFLAEHLRSLAGTDTAIEYLPVRKGDIQDSLADISKIRELLGYEPEVRFSEGLHKVWQYYKAQFI